MTFSQTTVAKYNDYISNTKSYSPFTFEEYAENQKLIAESSKPLITFLKVFNYLEKTFPDPLQNLLFRCKYSLMTYDVRHKNYTKDFTLTAISTLIIVGVFFSAYEAYKNYSLSFVLERFS